jgi:hypothetical protein
MRLGARTPYQSRKIAGKMLHEVGQAVHGRRKPLGPAGAALDQKIFCREPAECQNLEPSAKGRATIDE